MSYEGSRQMKRSSEKRVCETRNRVTLLEIHAKCWRCKCLSKAARVRAEFWDANYNLRYGVLGICAHLWYDEFSAENVCGQSKFETILALMDVASLVMNGSDLIAATWMNV
jgi:hypothetical protein